MIEVSEAIQIILGHAISLPKVTIPIEKSVGRVLMEEIVADQDFPPFDRVMMDGIAIDFKSFENGQRAFKIEGIQAAGQERMILKNPQSCLEAMTGAVLPKGCDSVVQYEWLEIDKEKGIARIIEEGVELGKNIHRKGEDKKAGDLLMSGGRTISAAEVAILASVGKEEVVVTKHPKVAIISTGDELVDIGEKPLPHQIRRSNVHALHAELFKLGIKGDLFHLRDEKEELLKSIDKILKDHDVLLLSGGVSMGKFDFLPEVFKELNVTQLFYKIRQKPGKPFWFGKKGDKSVFAFPGNSVSTFLCFHRYFMPWLQKSLGIKPGETEYASLSEDIYIKTDFTFFLQVRLSSNKEGVLVAYPRFGRGSGDHANLLDSDGFLQLSGGNEYKKGMAFPVFRFR